MSGDCILWQKYKTSEGYGTQWWRGKTWAAHRVAYVLAYGEIPEGLTVDHLCFTPSCINPLHLRLLTPSENARNKQNMGRTHCINNHPYDEKNTYHFTTRYGTPARRCRVCTADSQRRYQKRKAAR